MATVARNRPTLPSDLNPLEAFEAYADLSHEVPSIMEFAASDAYLNKPNLYPRQATLLKVLFLQDELFTEYDYHVIGEWEESYRQTADEKGEGSNGIVPGVLERIKLNKAEGRSWFREFVSVIGRRGSKGHIGAFALAYVTWNYLAKGDPQDHYGIDRDKRLAAFIFGGKKEQAVANQWRDVNNLILGAPCFSRFISKAQTESLTLYSRYDFIRLLERSNRGVFSDGDPASFAILPKESTLMAGRGPASFAQVYDEAGHVVKGVAKAPAEDVYEAATPALDQFGVDAFIYIPSSPWQRIGLLHDKYQQAIEQLDPTEGEGIGPAYPEMLMVQLTSWDIYKDWEMANQLRMEPGGLRFRPLKKAVQSYDRQMRQLERANPETFAVERRSKFAAVLDAYLNPDRIATIWEPWRGVVLTQQDRGILSRTYRAHGDPSKSGANFGFSIAHVEGPDERGLPHVVFDVIKAWIPQDFEGGEIDYDAVDQELEDYLDRFMPTEMTFDQFNSVSTIQRLQRHAQKAKYPKRVVIYERPATGPLNWKTAETFKTALGLGLIHGPYHELANLEMTFLQDRGGKVDHPTAGPVQTKDVWDTMAINVYELIGDQVAALIGKTFSEVGLGATAQGGMDPYHAQREDAHEALSAFGRGRTPGGGQRRRRR